MYLINTYTLKLEYFIGECPVRYAILSHTWGTEEVTFADLSGNRGETYKNKAGFIKIRYTCKQARNDGLRYAWIDTCCINKDSSAELSEAINSMYRWYKKADICYAYLADFYAIGSVRSSDLKNCRWFYRGWTLQELLAPEKVVFYGRNWTRIGTKVKMGLRLEAVTGIPRTILWGQRALDTVSVAARMSWAANRETSRTEDAAYCLLGIFDVNMPLLYGEGEKAFLRLQSEIMSQTQDDSLFAWCADFQSAMNFPYRGLYAKCPKEFATCGDIKTFGIDNKSATTFFGNGRISLNCGLESQDERPLVAIKCYRKDILHPIAIQARRIGANTYLRFSPYSLFQVSMPQFDNHIIIERYAERSQMIAIPDMHQVGSIYLGNMPNQLQLHSTLPNGLMHSTQRRISAIDAMKAKKVAFHIGFSRQYLQDKKVNGSESFCDVLLVFWVAAGDGHETYYYLFEVVRVIPVQWSFRSANEEYSHVSNFFKGEGKPKALSHLKISMGDLQVYMIPTTRVVEGHEVMYVELALV
ncbi:hypothetical protein PFICI_14067 [Pestalotiopsis fici W106-1]|uniref:Heterokaryon incompatibility domain-containing protein n=1 Tax=Pestalotiopsis fici (strain W106-1 / CGMCC3.15140) TaxID=1229662 RepID=W3WN07_PESFW|nr:uncharacterized protein PFICI_14067 [Pestalotiopsis fici W106-1]ETS74201.1 hypothetical protein PFICI_14067 [Pestalotiopsis fici W106-1]